MIRAAIRSSAQEKNTDVFSVPFYPAYALSDKIPLVVCAEGIKIILECLEKRFCILSSGFKSPAAYAKSFESLYLILFLLDLAVQAVGSVIWAAVLISALNRSIS